MARLNVRIAILEHTLNAQRHEALDQLCPDPATRIAMVAAYAEALISPDLTEVTFTHMTAPS